MPSTQHHHCYCSSLPGNRCDFCTGLRTICGDPCSQCDTGTGTRWTEPGRGATLGLLYERVAENGGSAQHVAAEDHLEHLARAIAPGLLPAWDAKTSLRLTGAPLTAEDLKRIEQAEVGRPTTKNTNTADPRARLSIA